MVKKNYFRMMSDKEASQYKFDFCKNCPFYECELVEEYTQFRKSHTQIRKAPVSATIIDDSFDFTKTGGVLVQATEVRVVSKLPV